MRFSAAVVAGLLLAAGCAAPAPPSQTPGAVNSSIVRMAWTDSGVLTPFRVSTLGPGGLILLSLVYDTLVWKDAQALIPWLATAWDVSADGRDYTFTLTKRATWHDGQPLTPSDVAFSFDYYAQHPYRWQGTDLVESASQVASDQVRIRLKQPFAPFLEDIAAFVPIIPRHIWQNVSDPERYDGANATVGSGPYRVADYHPAEGTYRLLANPSYFAGKVSVDEVQQLNIPAETRIQSVQQHQVELVWSPDASVIELTRSDPRLEVIETQPLSIVRLAVNTTRPPLDRREVRQALMLALDRARIAEVVTHAPPVVGSAGVVPPESPWFNPDLPVYGFEPQRARELLGGTSFTLELLADPAYREPELIQPMLLAVGVTLNIKRVDAKTRTQLLREGNFEIAEVQHLGVGGDPDFMRRWQEGVEANDFAQGWTFTHDEFTQLAAAQASTLDPAARRAIVYRMQAILADELPTLPLYHRRFYWVYDQQRYGPMNTWGGLMNALPFVQNKLTFLRR
jgi:peptide/nickel transport system substrate-binding protein